MRNRPIDAALVATASPGGAAPTNAALTCPCGPSAPQQQKKVDLPKRADPDPPKRVVNKRRPREPADNVVVVHRPPQVYYEPEPGPVIRGGIGIGIGGGYGGGYGGGNYGRRH